MKAVILMQVSLAVNYREIRRIPAFIIRASSTDYS